MKKEEIVAIAVRLFAIFLFVYAVRMVPGMVVLIRQEVESIDFIFGLVFLASHLLVALLLWVFALAIARTLLPGGKPGKAPARLALGDIQAVAFSVMGLWVLASAVPDIFYWGSFLYQTNVSGWGYRELSPENTGNIVSTLVELAIGLWLLFGARGLAGLVKMARGTGAGK